MPVLQDMSDGFVTCRISSLCSTCVTLLTYGTGHRSLGTIAGHRGGETTRAREALRYCLRKATSCC